MTLQGKNGKNRISYFILGVNKKQNEIENVPLSVACLLKEIDRRGLSL